MFVRYVFLGIFVLNKESMFSKACEYGIRSTIYIMMQSLEGYRISLKEIASAIDSPVAYTAKILQVLVRNGIIYSVKGPHGGFEIPKSQMDTLTLHEIVMAIDGEKLLTGCCLGLPECSDDYPCPAHQKYSKVRDHLKNMMLTTSVYEMAVGHGIGLTNLGYRDSEKEDTTK